MFVFSVHRYIGEHDFGEIVKFAYLDAPSCGHQGTGECLAARAAMEKLYLG